MQDNALARLERSIAAAACERKLRDRKADDEQAARTRLREEAQAIWAIRKGELLSIVRTIDGMLKSHGYAGLTLERFELKHTDIDRVVLSFEHNHFNHSKILICATRDGHFTLARGTSMSGNSVSDAALTIKMSDLTQVRLEEALSMAVEDCLHNGQQPVAT